MVSLTAARTLARNYYESTDFDPDADETTSYTNVEYLIDDLIDWVNTEAGTSISSMSGTAGEKTVTLTAAQNAVISMILPVLLRDTKYRINNSSGLGPASVSESIGGMDTSSKQLFYKALKRLRGVSFVQV